jgi:hypothetical protein
MNGFNIIKKVQSNYFISRVIEFEFLILIELILLIIEFKCNMLL